MQVITWKMIAEKPLTNLSHSALREAKTAWEGAKSDYVTALAI
jgi:hypothetical protein